MKLNRKTKVKMKKLEAGSPEAFAWARRMKKARKIRRSGRKAEKAFFGKGGPLEVKGNPITVVGLANPPRSVHANIEGIIYNRCIEIRAEKTGYKKGFYKHPFSRGSQVCIYALDNGDLLVHSKAGVKLWQPD